MAEGTRYGYSQCVIMATFRLEQWAQFRPSYCFWPNHQSYFLLVINMLCTLQYPFYISFVPLFCSIFFLRSYISLVFRFALFTCWYYYDIWMGEKPFSSGHTYMRFAKHRVPHTHTHHTDGAAIQQKLQQQDNFFLKKLLAHTLI